jgi:hypothetical protein
MQELKMTYLSRDDANRAFIIYDSEISAENAMNTLVQNGIRPDHIVVLMPDNEATRNFALKMTAQVPAGVSEEPTANLP